MRNKKLIGCVTCLIALLFFQCKETAAQNVQLASDNERAAQVFFNLQDLEKVEGAIRNNEEPYLNAFNSLIEKAEVTLQSPVRSVMDKTQTPPSGNKHDYMSIGPYWWSDSTKNDGLPWIRKDGKVNPLTRGNNVDQPAKTETYNNIILLSYAYFFSGDKRFAEKANQLISTWFIDSETRMNPNLNYGQSIPGRTDGRCYGLIEFASTANLLAAVELLKVRDGISPERYKDLQNWYADFLNWMETDELGIEEKTRKNNHGTWYDVQRVSTLIFLNKTEEVKTILESVKSTRIDTQIESDGSQPHELDRTKSVSYSTMNLKAFTLLAFYGKKYGIDLFNYENLTGGSIAQAYKYFRPYLADPETWKHKQLGSIPNAFSNTKQLFAFAGSKLDINNYCGEFSADRDKTDTDILLNPCF